MLFRSGVGIDILFDSPQAEDAELLGVLHGMKTPVFLAYADNKTNPEAITWEQEQDLRRFIATAKTTVVQPASILLETDADGVARYWPRQYKGLPSLLSVALTNRTDDADPEFAQYRGRIRYRTPTSVDRPVFDKIPIDMLADPDLAPLIADKIQGRYLLIGGDF